MKSISYVVCKHLYFVQPFLGKHVPRNEGLSFSFLLYKRDNRMISCLLCIYFIR